MKAFAVQKRVVALLLVVAFVSFLGAESLPAGTRESGKEETSVRPIDSEMGSIEKSDTPQPVVKKKRFPWLIVAIGGVVVLGAAAYLVVKSLSKGYRSIIVHYQVTFSGSNLKTNYKVFVDDQLKLDEAFVFDIHFSQDFSTSREFVREFTVEKNGLGQMKIRVEAGPSYELIWGGESASITPPIFDLAITSYDFGGKDPGSPVLGKNHFQILSDPFEETSRIKEEIVTISAPASQQGAQIQGKAIEHVIYERR